MFQVEGQQGIGYKGKAYYSQKNVEVLSSAIDELKQYYQPEKVILVGNSSGAALSILLISQYHDIADAVVASACPCSFSNGVGVIQP